MSTRHSIFLAAALCTTAIVPAQAASDLGARLLDAAHQDNVADVRALLKAHAPVNATEGDGATALGWAAANVDMDMVKMLLAAGADPNKANDNGVTPLSLACQTSNTPIAIALLSAHAKPDLAMWTGETPLMFAARTGNTDIMKALIQHGAKVNAHETRFGQTALMWAADAGKTDAVRLLIASKANVDMETPRADVKVVSAGAPNGFSTLLSAKKGGLTALMFAANSPNGNNDMVDALIAAGASVNRQAADGTTPLLFSVYRHVNQAAKFPHDFEVVSDASMAEDLIKKHGANPNIADANGVTPLMATVFSAFGGDFLIGQRKPHDATAEAAAKVLLAGGADPNIMITNFDPPESAAQDVRYPVTYANVSPFMLAAAFNKQKLVDMMMATGRVNINKPRASGDTPLMDAVTLVAPIAVNALLKAGVDVNAVNPKNGQTALHMAAMGPVGSGPIAKALVDAGAKYDIKDSAGKTALDLAKAGGNGCVPGEPCRIGSGTVVDALLSIKDGKPVAPDQAIIVAAAPTEPEVTVRGRAQPPGTTGSLAMVAIAAGKPIPAGPAGGGRRGGGGGGQGQVQTANAEAEVDGGAPEMP